MKLLKVKNYKVKDQSGYIALMSAIIISVLLLVITVSLGLNGFFGRLNILDSESKERGVGLAEACADTAILKLANNLDYTLVPADHLIPVGSDTCDIFSINPTPPRTSSVTIKTQAIINKATTNLLIVVDSNDFTITSWDECSNLTGSPSSC